MEILEMKNRMSGMKILLVNLGDWIQQRKESVKTCRASLVARWLRIRLPMQGTRVRTLVWEDPTCRGATRPVSHNYWACASGACASQQESLQQWEARAPRWRVDPRLPWWRSGWESACQCRGHGFVPRSGKIPHAAERLGPWATATEPARLEPVLRNRRGYDSERPAHRDEEWPPLAATGESPCTETKTQHSKNK